ncbi:MAG: hypothetical protein OXH00_18495 [Candidatus Poribacteria bacterium]|nr:hypothetical protein [Candidatus Poribacteria bacterium]
MNACPYTNESATCNLLSPEVAGTTTYCSKCSQFAFQCTEGHWNRAFARYCTQCSQELKKPAQWDMASGNSQRTATFSVDSVDINLGLNSGVVNTPPIETSENLPGMLVIDGLFVLPNSKENRFEACTIVNTENSVRLHHQWGIDFDTPLTYGSTPIYHGLHLYSVVSGGIQKTSVIDGKTKLIYDINGVDAAQIEPLSGCASLKCKVNGKPTMITGVNRGMLLFDLAKHNGLYINHDFFDKRNEPMSPTLCGQYVFFTSKHGGIFSLNIGVNPFKRRSPPPQNRSFSAPVSLNGLVYFEALNDNGMRSLACFDPTSGQLSKAADMDSELIQHLEGRRALFTHPPLTDGKRLYLSDRYGHGVYTYDSDKRSYPAKQFQDDTGKHRFIPHQSIVVDNRIYSAHSSGLTVWEFDRIHHVQTHSLSMGNPTTPTPVARPIQYGDKLFVLCKDRFICRDY